MWRQITRRALHCGRDPAVKLRTSIAPTLPIETIASARPSIEYSTHFFKKPNLRSHARFFSSNPVENYEDPAIPEANGNNPRSDFSAMNKVDESTKTDLESDDCIFDGAVDGLDLNEGVGLDLEGTSAIHEHAASLEKNDGIVEELIENDPEKVEGLLSLLQSNGDPNNSMESGFEALGLLVDEDLLLKVLETPNVSGKNLIDFFWWVMKKPGFKISIRLIDALSKAVRLEGSTKELYTLWDLLKMIDDKVKGVVSTECLNGLIEEFSRLGKGKIAYEVFNTFEELGCAMNADTYYFTINALCKRSLYDLANLVCEKMLSEDKLPRNVERVGKIISNLCKGGMAKEAHLVYLCAKDYKIYPSQSSVDFLINSLSRIGKGNKKTGKEVDKELDIETISLALGILEEYPTENRKYANKLLEMIESGPAPGNEAFNCVINGLTKLGDMNEAINLLQLMKGRGLKPDVYTYSVIMSGYVRAGEIEEACKIFEEAKKKHSKLPPVTYHTMIRGFCRVEQFDKAVDLVREMKQHGVTPSHDEYNKLIKSLCFKALDWETAEKLRNEMEENGVILNGRTTALIRAVKELKEDASSQ